ncbi:hypothetical protein DPSP01_012727 [Paraphaeosphaeria sporulosa]|uniref:HET-domain-containing protein n=1 Tax=Paraphaeosphaeria sporulosa TaxID=1460663 RepID=A0A177BUT5_9PLEO|nr:HET-domain-containing protein [Paraphaeosphaeria sporulosa]OAF99233.1 HET-domain-containing protein [Paraphaeosphaeria sporulosa]
MAGNISALQALPIDASGTSIRLLKVEPKSRDRFQSQSKELLSLSTEVFGLDDRARYHAYRALSYTWGPPEPTKAIALNGIVIRIRKNLFDFLDMYAHEQPDECKYLWIDQLCIDQNNTQERNHQVGIMHRIYAEAYEVVAWLGLDEDGSERVMKCLSGFSDVAFLGDSRLRGVMKDDKRKMLLENFEAVKALLGRDYWGRLWIIQEVLLAVRLKVYCGRLHCDGADFESLLGLMMIANDRIPRGTQTNIFGEEMWQSNPITYRNSLLANMDISEALLRFSEASCVDPRDKIFGLGAIISSSHDLTIDYGMSCEEVYMDTCCKLYETDRREVAYEALRCLSVQAKLHVSLELASDIEQLVRLKKWPENSSRHLEIFRKYLQRYSAVDAAPSVSAS